MKFSVTDQEKKALCRQVPEFRSYMESIADIIPEFNEDGAEAKRAKFIYNGVKERTNIDWSVYDKSLEEINIEAVSDDLMAEARRLRREYSENIKEEQYGDHDDNGIVDANDQHEAMYGDYTPDEGGEDLNGKHNHFWRCKRFIAKAAPEKFVYDEQLSQTQKDVCLRLTFRKPGVFTIGTYEFVPEVR